MVAEDSMNILESIGRMTSQARFSRQRSRGRDFRSCSDNIPWSWRLQATGKLVWR
jgi:hypothetical protein